MIGQAFRPAQDRSRAWSLAGAHALVATIGTLITVVVLVAPDLATGLRNPELRLVIEVSGLFFAAIAALVLALTERADLGHSRDAFIAALLVLAATNGVFTVAPAVFNLQPSLDPGLAFYPWVASRFLAGALMVAALFDLPRLGLARTVGAAFTVLIAIDVLLVGAGQLLPATVELGADATVEVSSVGLLTVLMLLPAVLFAIGSWSAARIHARGAAPLYAWLSVAMSTQVFSQLHGVIAPAFLGPNVTTMDVFRTSSWVLLAGGAIAQLRHLYVARSRTAEQQARDLGDQARLLSAQQLLAEREQHFRAVVSHELATPIAAIRAFGHVICSPVAKPEQREQAVVGLRAEAARLAELVDRIDELEYLDVTELTCDLRPVAVRPLLEEIRAFASGLPGRSDVNLTCDDDRISADPVRLGQLLRNLMGNAARYSPEGEPIELRGSVIDRETYCIAVIDRGPGIPVDERESLMQPYARGTDTAERPGSGLGLHIARRLAEAHGGKLRILDGPAGSGTTLSLTLRRAT